MSLTGIPSRLISRSEGRPPALWPSSRTIPARRAVRRANSSRKTRHALGEDAPITQLVSTPPAPGVSVDLHSLLRLVQSEAFQGFTGDSPFFAASKLGLEACFCTPEMGLMDPSIDRSLKRCRPAGPIRMIRSCLKWSSAPLY